MYGDEEKAVIYETGNRGNPRATLVGTGLVRVWWNLDGMTGID
jgi:hypothetical protein